MPASVPKGRMDKDMAELTDELLRLAASSVVGIRTKWLQVITRFLVNVSEYRINLILKEGGWYISKSNYDSIDTLIDSVGDSVSELVVPKLTDIWMASGRKVSSVLPKGSVVAPFSFDTARVSALSSAEGYRANFVRDITEGQRQTISQVINRGIIEGRSRMQTARDIRASIGLTQQQETWIDNYRRQLTNLDPAIFDRILRDRRSDRTIVDALESGGALTTHQVNSMVERYRQRMVKWRAENIARTEAVRAVRMGEWETLMAANEAGALSPLLRRFWVVTLDERLRRVHIPIPGMNAQGRAIDEPFQTPLGLMMYPLDPNGVARNVVNCRCKLVYRMPTASGEYKNVPIRSRPFPGLEDVGS